MLAKIFGNKSNHPMADIKAAHKLVAELPKDDAVKSLMELTDWIASVTVNHDFKMEHQFALIGMLDEASFNCRRTLSRAYFSAQELSQFQENRLWRVLGEWYEKAFEAYYTLFIRYCEKEKGSAGIKDSELLLVARTLRLMAAYLKYGCLHYGPVDAKIWTRLSVLYRHAEQRNYLDASVRLYSNLPQLTSVKLEAARLLAWHGCGVTSLSPLAMHLTEHIIAQFGVTLDVTQRASKNTLFGFDLQRPASPHRINVDTTIHPNMRFVSVSGLPDKLADLIKTLKKNIVPDDLILGGNYEAELVREAAEFLLDYVTELPRRQAVRHEVKVAAKVVHGYAQLLECAANVADAGGITGADWQLNDISPLGFYSLLPQRGNEHVRIGELVGMRPAGLPHWGVAVVRRLMRDDKQHLHVGAGMISNHVSFVRLSQSISSVGFEDGQAALWLHPKPGDENDGLVCLLMSHYVPNCNLETELDGKKYLLIPQALKKRKKDCDLVEFRVIEREEDDE